MRMQVRLPKIQPGGYFKPHGRKGEIKSVRDTDHKEMTSQRYKCISCDVYPVGVSPAQQVVDFETVDGLRKDDTGR